MTMSARLIRQGGLWPDGALSGALAVAWLSAVIEAALHFLGVRTQP